MTLEQECFRGDQDYTWKQRLLSRILRKLGEQALPGAFCANNNISNIKYILIIMTYSQNEE